MASNPHSSLLNPESRIPSTVAGYFRVAGVDEAGRGPLAGPVVAAAVILRDGECPEGVGDSKALSPARREALYRRLVSTAHWAVGIAAVEEIDRLNILNATQLAMRRALEALTPPADFALVDGLPVKGLPVPHRAIVRGDARCLSISAASIIAKVTRDRMMLDLHNQYPVYGFDRHKGYGTPQHLRALGEHGPCPSHRRSFAPVLTSEFRVPKRQPRNSEPGTPNPKQALGAEGERRAALALEGAGYTVVERNARVGHDELDIVCRHEEAWVFVEVKTRRGSGYGAPDEAVTPRKQAKLIRAAQGWLVAHDISDPEWRFDVVAVLFQNGAPPSVDIIVNAFGD
jgi:ribonuclease HII